MRSRTERPEPTADGGDEIDVVSGPAPGPAVDEGMLRNLVESEAREDATSGMYDVNLGAHGHPLLMEHKIDRWNHRWSADAEMRQQNDQNTAQLRYRSATRRHATRQKTKEHLEQDLQETCAYRERMHRIVAGTEPGDDGATGRRRAGSTRTIGGRPPRTGRSTSEPRSPRSASTTPRSS